MARAIAQTNHPVINAVTPIVNDAPSRDESMDMIFATFQRIGGDAAGLDTSITKLGASIKKLFPVGADGRLPAAAHAEFAEFRDECQRRFALGWTMRTLGLAESKARAKLEGTSPEARKAKQFATNKFNGVLEAVAIVSPTALTAEQKAAKAAKKAANKAKARAPEDGAAPEDEAAPKAEAAPEAEAALSPDVQSILAACERLPASRFVDMILAAVARAYHTKSARMRAPDRHYLEAAMDAANDRERELEAEGMDQ
jgi:hypothetical protein